MALPAFPNHERVALRLDLIFEETQELVVAVSAYDIIEVADALADLLYVTYGAALEFGIPIDRIFEEVHRSNMTKLGEDGQPLYREGDAKVLKGPNYERPNIEGVLFQGLEDEEFHDLAQEMNPDHMKGLGGGHEPMDPAED